MAKCILAQLRRFRKHPDIFDFRLLPDLLFKALRSQRFAQAPLRSTHHSWVQRLIFALRHFINRYIVERLHALFALPRRMLRILIKCHLRSLSPSHRPIRDASSTIRFRPAHPSARPTHPIRRSLDRSPPLQILDSPKPNAYRGDSISTQPPDHVRA